MNNITVNIKNVVKKNLTEKRKSYINESYNKLKSINDKDQKVLMTLVVSAKLMDEGYSLEEVNQHLNEFSLGGEDIDWGGMVTGAMWGEAKEFVIKWITEALGFNDTFGTILAQGLSTISDPRDLIRPFKDMSTCVSSIPKVTDAVLIVVVRQLGSSVTNTNTNDYGWSGVGSNLVGQMFGEAIKKSNLGETLGGLVCKAIH